MTIYNIGSINVDHLYRVSSLPAPGETVTAQSYVVNLGGKGLNMTVAALRAGAEVKHVGAVGWGDQSTREMLAELGVDDLFVSDIDGQTGHAVVYVDSASENSIAVYGGANKEISQQHVNDVLKDACPDDWLLLQNETNANHFGIEAARTRGMKIALVAAPFDPETLPNLIDKVDLVSMNETELDQYQAATGRSFGDSATQEFLITYGNRGSEYIGPEKNVWVDAFPVDPIDTTAAGDTFFGMFLARLAGGAAIKDAMRFASAGAALKVTRAGAAMAIPTVEEIERFLENRRPR